MESLHGCHCLSLARGLAGCVWGGLYLGRESIIVQKLWFSILVLVLFFLSAKESITSAKTSNIERKETKQEEKSYEFPPKDSESPEKQAAE